VVFFISTNVLAKCLFFDKNTCPTTDCSEGTFMGDDGKCYSCNTDESIGIECIGYEKAFKLCPNRFFTWACKTYSKLKCFDEKLIERITDKDGDGEKEIYLIDGIRYWINYTTHRCRNPDISY
jgi:hypothetical protein